MIQSRITRYYNAKYPWIYWISGLCFIVGFLIWLVGILIGWIFLSKEKSTGMALWMIGWIGLGSVYFTMAFWRKIGIQILTLTPKGLQIKKQFGPLIFSRIIPYDRIYAMEVAHFEPFNPLTGNTKNLNKQLGWLQINHEGTYFVRSYLYEQQELEYFILEWRTNFAS